MKHEPAKWKADYDRDGYLVVEDAVDPQTLGELKAGIEEISRDPDALPPRLREHVHMERDYVKQQPHYNDRSADQVGNAIRNIMETPLFGQPFRDILVYKPILDVLEALFDSSEFHFHNYKCIIKAPQVSSVFRWHRDLPYLEHTTPNLITAMICLDPMTEENGATVVMPGSHRLVDDKSDKADMDMPEEKLPDLPRVSVECSAGSLVLFHVNIVHGGPANRSDIPRRNLIGIWAGPDTYPITTRRFQLQGVYPKSKDPAKIKQIHMTFPHLFGIGHKPVDFSDVEDESASNPQETAAQGTN